MAEEPTQTGAESADGNARSASLDVTDAELSEIAGEFVALTNQYFARVAKLPVAPDTTADELAQFFQQTPPAEGEPLARLLDDCRALINSCRHNGHPRMYGYVASPSTPIGAYANLFASAINQNVPVWRSSPAGVTIERQVVRWLGELINYGEDCGGLLTSGGSMANFNAVFVALRTKAGDARDGSNQQNDDARPSDSDKVVGVGRVSQKGLWKAGAPATMYVSDQAHGSLAKAADLLGIGREQVRVVASDENFRMDVRELRARIIGDIEQNLRPFCVVASAGTVNTGAIDPLSDIAAVAREHDLWFHIDGAYGALAALDASKRHLFAGLELADSVTLDPHKWLYAPVDCGCLLYRRPELARAAFGETDEENYIKVFEEQPDDAFAFWDYGVELSRPFRALKIWLMLRYYGTRRVASAIAEDCALAAYFDARLRETKDFETLAPVTLGICCFRYVPHDMRRALDAATDEASRAELNAQLDDLNARIMRRIQRGGIAYISNATLRGRFALRASITNFRTTRRDINITLDAIRDAGLQES